MTDVTVVIVTRDRADILGEALDALRGQTRPPDRILVVDDGSTDATAGALDAAEGVDAIHTPPRGIAAARNAGWRAATTEVVAFTDDDCVPSPEWLEELLRPIEAGTADVVQGRTLPRPDHADREGPWSRTLRVESEQGYYQTANIAYRRVCLEAVGGFDEQFARVGEDTDVAWRVREAGFRTTFASDALVHHAVWPFAYGKHLRDRAKWADVVAVLARHPDLRTLAHRRIWYRPSHERVVAEAAAVAIASRVHVVAGVAALGGVLAARARPAGRFSRDPVRRLLLAGQGLVADGYETACFVASSVRHRTLLL